jgi:ubiquinone/menaquinone biosynthesis C-methylase UbiE
MSRRFYDLLQREARLDDGARLLDVGCGTGALIKRLCASGNIDAHGVDADVEMIAVALSQYPAGTFKQAPSERIPYPNESFDVLTACMAYHHFSDKAGFAQEAARLLKPGGCLYIADAKFPFLIRKTINGIARLVRVVGEFLTAQEIADRFSEYGFQLAGTAFSGYAQVVKLVRK